MGIHLSWPRSAAPQHRLHELTSFARFAQSPSDAEILSASVIRRCSRGRSLALTAERADWDAVVPAVVVEAAESTAGFMLAAWGGVMPAPSEALAGVMRGIITNPVQYQQMACSRKEGHLH